MSAVVPYTRAEQPAALGDRHRWVVLLAEAAQLAHAIANTEFVPKAMRGNEAAISAAILYGDEVGLGPMQSLAKIAVIDGRPTLAAEAQRALILAAGHSIWFEETTATKATAVGQRSDNGITQRITFTLDDAKRAGLAGRQNWRTYPQAMLLARASAAVARAVFADVIGGLAATEELEDVGEPATGALPPEPPSDVVAEGKTTRRRRAAPRTPPVVTPPPPPGPDVPPAPPLPEDLPPAKATQKQMAKLFKMFAERGMTDRDDRLDWSNRQLDRTIVSASELTDVEASQLIDALEQIPPTAVPTGPAPEPPAPTVGPAEPQPTLDDLEPLVTSERVDVLMFLRRESGVSDEWLHAWLADIGHTGLPKRITREHLGRLSRAEAIALSDALSTKVDEKGP